MQQGLEHVSRLFRTVSLGKRGCHACTAAVDVLNRKVIESEFYIGSCVRWSHNKTNALRRPIRNLAFFFFFFEECREFVYVRVSSLSVACLL